MEVCSRVCAQDFVRDDLLGGEAKIVSMGTFVALQEVPWVVGKRCIVISHCHTDCTANPRCLLVLLFRQSGSAVVYLSALV